MSDSFISNDGIPIPENGQSSQNGNLFTVCWWWIVGKFWNLIMFSIQTNTKALVPFILLFIIRLCLTFYSVDSANSLWGWLIGFVVYIVDFLIGLILIARTKLLIDESVDKKINVKFETHVRPIEERLDVYQHNIEVYQHNVERHLKVLTDYIMDKDKKKKEDKDG